MVKQPRFYNIGDAMEWKMQQLFNKNRAHVNSMVIECYDIGEKKMMCYLYMRFPLNSQIPDVVTEFEKICNIKKVENRDELIEAYHKGEWAAANWYVETRYDIESRPM